MPRILLNDNACSEAPCCLFSPIIIRNDVSSQILGESGAWKLILTLLVPDRSEEWRNF